MHRTGIVADSGVMAHQPGPGHPERPERFTAVMGKLKSAGLLDDLLPLTSREATEAELAVVHEAGYVTLVEREVAQKRPQLSTGDTDIGPHSFTAAKIAAGSVLAASDAVLTGQVANAFCVVRPPGHHASARRGMGFCLFNNVAVGARYAQRRYGVERILIADWDVHHGNGTQDLFYRDGSVLFFSTHQYPWYPGTGDSFERGEGEGAGTTINCPMPAGSGREEILGAFRQQLIPAAWQFRPDLIFISAGFDSRRGDPLGQFLLSDNDFRELTQMMIDLAAECCGGRLVSVLEGGYNLDGLALAAEAHVRGLMS